MSTLGADDPGERRSIRFVTTLNAPAQVRWDPRGGFARDSAAMPVGPLVGVLVLILTLLVLIFVGTTLVRGGPGLHHLLMPGVPVFGLSCLAFGLCFVLPCRRTIRRTDRHPGGFAAMIGSSPLLETRWSRARSQTGEPRVAIGPVRWSRAGPARCGYAGVAVVGARTFCLAWFDTEEEVHGALDGMPEWIRDATRFEVSSVEGYSQDRFGLLARRAAQE